MNNYFIQFVLSQRNGDSEGIVQLLIFVFIIIAGVIKSLFAAKQEQNRQNQKKPSPHSSVQRKPPASAEQIRMQRERVEQFLEGILQPKKRPLQQSSRPVNAKPQAAGVVPDPAKAISVSKVYENQSIAPDPYREISVPVRQAEPDTILDTNAIKIDTQPEEVSNHREEQEHLIFQDKPKKTKVSEHKSPNLMFAFSDSDDLRKAIIYTEILGRPISMRESEALYD